MHIHVEIVGDKKMKDFKHSWILKKQRSQTLYEEFRASPITAIFLISFTVCMTSQGLNPLFFLRHEFMVSFTNVTNETKSFCVFTFFM